MGTLAPGTNFFSKSRLMLLRYCQRECHQYNETTFYLGKVSIDKNISRMTPITERKKRRLGEERRKSRR